MASSGKKWIFVIVGLIVLLCLCCLIIAVLFFVFQPDTNFLEEIDIGFLSTPTTIIVAPQELQPNITPEKQITPESGIPDEMLLISSNLGIFGYNTTKQEMKQITNDPLDSPWEIKEGFSPDHHYFAYNTGFGGASINPTLIVLTLPNQKTIFRQELSGPESQVSPMEGPGDTVFEAMRATQYPGSLAWSPDGKKLAFIAAIDGPTADIYLFDLSTNTIQRISDEPFHAANLSWSPDGEHLVYITISSFGTGAGLGMEGLWQVNTTSRQAVQLDTPSSGAEEFLGWLDKDTILLKSWSPAWGYYHLRKLNIHNLEETTIYDSCFSTAIFDTFSHTGYLGIDEISVEYCDIGHPLQSGIYEFTAESIFLLTPQSSFSFELFHRQDMVIAHNQTESILIQTDGTIYELPSDVQHMSPYPSDGQYWAWVPSLTSSLASGLWISDGINQPFKIYDFVQGEPVWSWDGQAVYFIGNGKLIKAAAPEFRPLELSELPGSQIEIAK